jgi:hypothetical protein
MDSVIKQIYTQDLTGQQVEIVTNGKCPVHLYKDLRKFDNVREVIGENNACIVLFPVKSSSSGHWIAILYHPETNTVEHFDPYGFSWNTELNYTEDPTWTQYNLLGKLYNDAREQGYNVIYNPYRFQKLKDGINTCGKHSAIRCRFRYLNIEEYKKLMMGQSQDPDYLVTILTFISLRNNQVEKETIENIVSK